MKRFEYEISRHSAEGFRQVVYFCSDEGECNLEHLPTDQVKVLAEVLNQRGAEGWEVVHMSFSKDGLVAFWKREIISRVDS
jgi:hypothetical protein